MRKILLDTDIGTDIDDAVCLAYLLSQPECDLLGITTVSGEAERRASIADALCRAAGRDIPIFPGADKPLLVDQLQTYAQQANALGSLSYRQFQKGKAAEAIEFLRQTIRTRPGEVDLLTIGPLTNIGLLFALNPEIPSLLKSLTMMVGHYAPGAKREWNAFGDPHATAIVFRSGVKPLRAVGLDVTTRVVMSAAEARQRFQTGLLQPVLGLADYWFQKYGGLTFHDPLAAVTLFDERACAFQKGTVRVELGSESTAGTTVWTPGGEDAPHEAAFEVDPPRFYEHFFSVFPKAN